MYETKERVNTIATVLNSHVARDNKGMAQTVRKGITLQQIHGTEYAARFLQENNINEEVISRVLLNLSVIRRHDDLLEMAD